MNHNFRNLIGAALMGGLGLCVVAPPASAAAILGMVATTNEIDVTPGGGPVTAQVIYNSVNGSPVNGAPAGLSFQNDDPTASFSFSPNPSLAQGGLGAGTIGVTAVGASATVSANVATGTTHILATSSDNGVTEGNSVTSVQMVDQLTFLVTGNDGTISLAYALDGLLSLGGEASYNQSIRYSIGGADMEWEAQSAGDAIDTANTTGFDTSQFTNLSITGFNFLGTTTVTNGETLEMFFTESMNCNAGAVCDFSNTGQMGLILPSDVSFTSTGGFLSQGVPEPGSMLLIGLGFAGIACVRRRQAR